MIRSLTGFFLLLAACGEEPLVFPKDYETSWGEVSPCSESAEHGGSFVRIFVNDTAKPTWTDWAQRVADAGSVALPPGEMISFAPGSVLLKSQYTDSGCSTFQHWTMMTRLETGGDTANGNWRWEIVKADEEGLPTTPVAGGAGCFGCYQAYRRTDYAGNPPQLP